METVKMIHAAIVKVSLKLLPKMLDFKGGIAHKVYMEDSYIYPDHFCVVIEHPDLEPVPENEELPIITPIMQTYYAENGGVIKVERIDPPKKVVVMNLSND